MSAFISKRSISIAMTTCLSMLSQIATADDASIAQKLANPVASLISVPIQINYDDKYGTVSYTHLRAHET